MANYTREDVIEFLRTIKSTSDEFIWVRLLHVDIDVQVDSDDIADEGGIGLYFNQQIEEYTDDDELQDYIKEEITNHDWILVDWEGTLTSHYANQYGFDAVKYQEAVDTCNANPTMTTEVIKACLECFGDACNLSEALENYQGEFKDDTELAYQQVEDSCLLEGVSETVKQYFDYELFGRDLAINDFCSYDGHYFRNC